MNCSIKKGPYKTDQSHVLSGNTHTFHMNMFLILLICHLCFVFIDFPGFFSKIKRFLKIVNVYTLNIRKVYNNYDKVLFLAA